MNLYISDKVCVHHPGFDNVIIVKYSEVLCLPVRCHIYVILIGHEGDLLRI